MGTPLRKPPWLKIRLQNSRNFQELKELLSSSKLHTVCEEARCPNVWECWERRSATIMILGDICTRSCGFCAVKTGRPGALDWDEPRRTAEAIARLGLRHCVLTSVDRDDLPDAGAAFWAETIRVVREHNPQCTIEVLTPDFKGRPEWLEQVFAARPDIMSHNLETVRRLHRKVRPQARYERSLEVLRLSVQSGLLTKTAVMVGLGETDAEIFQLMEDVRATGCQLFSIGQYLQPTPKHLPVERYVPLEIFERYREYGLQLGFTAVEAGPLVRSSYHADEQARLGLASRSTA